MSKAYISDGVHIFTNNFNFVHSRSALSIRLGNHAKGSIHILACEKLVEESDQNSKLANKNEIAVKVEMHDSDDEPLNKMIKLGDDVIDISCKAETDKKEIQILIKSINIEPTDEIENKIEFENKGLQEETILNYIEYSLKPKFQWLEVSEGKLFCKVRNMKIISLNLFTTFWMV